MAVASLAAILGCVVPAGCAYGGDWPQWGGTDARNMAANAKGLPDWFDCGKETGSGDVALATAKNVKWAVKLGPTTCGSPVVSGGKVFIGTTAKNGAGVLFCFDEQTGRPLGIYTCICPKQDKNVVRCNEAWGVASTPTIEGDRLYFVSPYQEVLCLDLKVWPGQERGGSTDKSAPGAAEKSLVWRYDLAKELHAVQDHVSSCSVLIYGDFLYVCTGNGRWRCTDENPHRPYFPLMPSLVVLNKKTGQLVARDDEQIGARLWRGQWSSPSLGLAGKKEQIYFGAGDGVCYAFEPVDAQAAVLPERWVETTQRDPIVQFFDFRASQPGGPRSDAGATTDQPVPQIPAANVLVEKRYSVGKVPICSPLSAMPTAKVPDVPLLKKIWWCDCIPDEYKKTPFDGQGSKGDGSGRPCEITATPVFYHNRVYMAIGADPNHGGPNSKGCLLCIDATRTGDVTKTGVIWKYKDIIESISTVAIGEGLVYAFDEASRLYCLDDETGQCYWTYQVMKGTGYHSPMLADGKLFVGGSILAAGKELKVLSSGLPAPQYSTPCVANGVLFTVLEKRLWAICDKGDKKPSAEMSAEKAEK